MSTDTATQAQQIFDEVKAAAEASRRYAIRNYVFAYAVSGVIVVSSVASGLMAGIGGAPVWLTSSLASLPAVMLTAATVLRFEQKSAWFWKKTKALDALVRKLRYEACGVDEASRLLSAIELDMEKDWVSFGTVGKAQH